ncbi:PAAR-like domain-containing protein [Pseudomonas sp.]|uniref:PAAR-like domain-containing protein n=1 Tax=Pseudomonas sp. TaxID=306 RepID=UPI003A969D11
MANEVYANNMEVSCKAADGKSIACFPDVCFTPPQAPPTPLGVPIPYPNTGLAKDTTRGTRTVKISGKEAMLKDKSYFKTSYGDEAGNAPKKGIITGKIKGKVYFTAWSMNVKFEAENVVRNMDLTTHNHGSTSNTGPWPYQDAIAMDTAGHPCQPMANDIKTQCSGATDKSDKCCSSRKCLLMPKTPNRCCDGADGKPMTGHHLLPSKEFVAHVNRGSADAATNYESDKAPCLCVEGHSHALRTEHGQVGCNYTVERNAWLANPANRGKAYTLAVGCEIGAKSAVGKVNVPPGATGCNKECLQKQLENGHQKMELAIKPNDPLPRAKQPPPAIVLDD